HVRVGHRQALIPNRPCSLAAGAVLFVRGKSGAIESHVQKDVHGKVLREITFPGSTRRKSLAHHRAVMVLSLTKMMCAFSLSLVLPRNTPAAFVVGAFFVRLEAPRIGLSASEFIRGMLISIMSGPGVASFGIFSGRKTRFFCVRRQVEKRVLKTSLVARDRMAGVLQVPESGV
ncbi:hypothetical protein, partial [Cobetia sp. 2AS]